MKLQNLTKAIALIAAAGVSSASFAADNMASKTGHALANTGDKVFSALTGKAVYQTVNHPVSLYDYDQATSAYEDAYINGRFNTNSNANPDKDGNKQQTSFDLHLDTTYDRVFSSPNSNTKVEARADADITKGSAKGAKTQDTWGAKAAVTYDEYFTPGSNGAFWYGKGDIAFKQKEGENGGFKNPKAGVSGGLGYGRVVNVTPMARSIRVIESLVERGILKSTPSKAVYNKVAQIVSKEAEYRSKYGAADYVQYWVRDVETAIGQNIGANGAVKAYSVLKNENVSTRKYGWDVRAGLGAQLSTYSGVNKKVSPKLEAEGNYYYPIGLQTQFSNEARFETVLDDGNNNYTINNLMGLTYEVSDRVDWVNSWELDYAKNDNTKAVTTNKLKTSYQYDISNAVTFDATLSLNHVSDGIKNNGNDNVETAFTTGIKYRLK